MNFDAFWEILKWIGMGAVGLLGWWVRDIRSDLLLRLDAQAKSYAESKQHLYKRIDECNADHRDAVRSLSTQIARLEAENARLSAEQGSMGKALEKLTQLLERVDEKMDVLALTVARSQAPSITAGDD